ncbi:MAG: hypothetical protein ACLT90_14230 [Enterococcus raffinosus]
MSVITVMGVNHQAKESCDYYFETVFKDAHGKKHKQKFQNADISMSTKKLKALLTILTKLTIFERDGIRKFAEVVFPDCKTVVGDL